MTDEDRDEARASTVANGRYEAMLAWYRGSLHRDAEIAVGAYCGDKDALLIVGEPDLCPCGNAREVHPTEECGYVSHDEGELHDWLEGLPKKAGWLLKHHDLLTHASVAAAEAVLDHALSRTRDCGDDCLGGQTTCEVERHRNAVRRVTAAARTWLTGPPLNTFMNVWAFAFDQASDAVRRWLPDPRDGADRVREIMLASGFAPPDVTRRAVQAAVARVVLAEAVGPGE